MAERFHPRERWVEVQLAPEQERAEREREFHLERVSQKESIALLVGDIMDAIGENPDIEIEKLKTIVDEYVPEIGLAEYQKKIAMDFIKAFEQRRKKLNELKAKGQTEKQLLEQVAHPKKGPLGKQRVDVSWRTFTVHFRVPSATYESIHGSQNLLRSGGFFDRRFPFATFEKRELSPIDDEVEAHEEMHAIYHLIREILSKHLRKTLFQRPSPDRVMFGDRMRHEGVHGPANDYVDQAIRAQTDRIKDEIFAFTRGYAETRTPRSTHPWPRVGHLRTPKEIISTLLKKEVDGGLYDYFRQDRNRLRSMVIANGGDLGSEIAEDYDKKMRAEHRRVVTEGVEAIENLIRAEGYSFMQAVVFFMDVPVERWKQELAYLKQSKES